MIQKVGASIQTPRELIMLKLGLRASHIEEAVAHGEATRAAAHVELLIEDLRKL